MVITVRHGQKALGRRISEVLNAFALCASDCERRQVRENENLKKRFEKEKLF